MSFFDIFKSKMSGQDIAVMSPLQGEILPLKDVPDEVFSSGMMGQGLAIDPVVELQRLKAPVSGKVSSIFPTGHAIGLTSNEGIEVLIHIGMDTVELEGKGFEVLVDQNDEIQVGDDLIKVDYEKIKGEGYEIITPIIITNMNELSSVKATQKSNVTYSDDLFIIDK
ncbi:MULTISPECIES: PTS sugar transporter subunit IIA [Aerococcus]|uniref:PTS sugar transporter subunit IIA n=1 Tax=Aerococcus TaxID=1375 RepID=UPI000DCB58B1|nr:MULTISPECIES: PTS glucose transporter subunit IIA [Aerococcus]KAA9295003.1 PTS glucose transporter subunit IIA [Aerococcus tenax]MDK6688147.1 PTS glucose transporter subunit IIA [Aerococcus urinae]MDK8132733.1 PTS glucose transporter subunit IIA [Aerococcus urinae]MDK8484347.1 PTS glucose transporter subunit IIA [Aerococcus urinae]MDL5179371.1 PTS glucose transporter subunit IIA [Aerococcus tenax]